MLPLWNTFWSSNGFIPHGHCYLWKPGLVWLHLISDALIAISYFSIPITLVYFISKRRDVPFDWVFSLFGAFIIACGTGHIADIWTLWHPTYWVSGFLKAFTAAVSVCTAILLVRLIPQALSIPSPAMLEAANHKLEQALRDLQQTQTQLIHTEKMSSLGQLVAGVAHEINNPVNFIHGNLTHASQYTQQLLQLLGLYEQHPQSATEISTYTDTIDLDFLRQDLPKILDSMRIGAERIRQIVLSLRNFSRLDEAERKFVNIHEGIDSTLLILQSRLKQRSGLPGITVIKDYSDIPLVECYAGQLNQVFMNILSNAIDALELVTSNSHKNQPNANTILIRTFVVAPEQVVIQIADSGPGMTTEVIQKLFDPFFTTKPVGKGTGLGLSISYQIVVEKHGGKLECVSTPGQGAEFLIRIPIRQPAQKSALPQAASVLSMELA